MEYMFGCGRGHLSDGVAKVAEEYGADLINYTDPGCSCGNGCSDDCPANRRHWFSAPNRGYPDDDRLARAVLSHPVIAKAREDNI